ncbi:MAG: gliding motility-associated C-terminal domain-containing protein [Bacteroidota bacterium]
MRNKKNGLLQALLFILISYSATAQFVPIPIGGFNQDVIAETGTSALTTTTSALDGVPASNNVMYTLGFASTNAFSGGGLPDNGIITDAAGTYQMADYAANNALIVPRSQNGILTLNTPGNYSSIRLLCLSTEGTSLVNVTLTFADGSTTNAITNGSVNDWFNASPTLVLSGFGRCARTTPVGNASAYPTNPKLFYLEVNLNCADAQKTLQSLNVANVTTAGSNAPFPYAVIFAISGKANSRSVSSTITDATCAVNGSATLNITGSAPPFNVSWNTTPAQTGLTATNLVAGNYIATITDANSCPTAYNVAVVLNNDLNLTAHIDTAICTTFSFVPNIVSNGTSYVWSPATGVSDVNIANPTLSPTSTVTYTVTATLGNCTLPKSFTVTVNSVNINNRADTSICLGSSFVPNIVSDATTYAWTPTTGVSDPAIANPILSPITTTTYSLLGTLGLCNLTRTFTVTLLQSVTVDAGDSVTILSGSSIQLNGSGSVGNYLWTPSNTLSASNILNPIASPTTTTEYYLTITTPAGCTNYDSVKVTVKPNCIKPANAFSPNGDGINDKWIVDFDNCASNVRALVYNRYGSKIYESQNYRNDWAGLYNGKPVPDGTYYFVIDFTSYTGEKTILKGNVTIIR